MYFTDVVKHYEVMGTKHESDKNGRKYFWHKAGLKENIEFLEQEFNLINPTHIIALGNHSFKFLNCHFGKQWKVYKVIHPAAFPQYGINGFERAYTTLKEILKSL